MIYHTTPFFRYIYNLYSYEVSMQLGKVIDGPTTKLMPANPDYRQPSLQALRESLGIDIKLRSPDNNWKYGDSYKNMYQNWKVTINGVEDDFAITTLFNQLSPRFNIGTMWDAESNHRHKNEFIGIVDFGDMNMGYPFLGVMMTHTMRYEETGEGSGIAVVRPGIVAGFVTGDIDEIEASSVIIEDHADVNKFEDVQGVKITRMTYYEACRKMLRHYESLYPEVDGNISFKVGSLEFVMPSFYDKLKQ